MKKLIIITTFIILGVTLQAQEMLGILSSNYNGINGMLLDEMEPKKIEVL